MSTPQDATARTAARTSADRRCARPACPHVPVASMSYDYAASIVYVGRLAVERDPSLYDLCRAHLDRISAPRGWSVRREPLMIVGADGSVAGADWTRGDSSSVGDHAVADRGAI